MSRSDNRYRLSKSKLAAFEHCPKRLWLQIHQRDAAQFDENTQARFRFGHQVGELARTAVPGGILIETGWDMPAAIAQTHELLCSSERRPIFEATFQFEDVLVRSDILLPEAGGAWRMVEVKGSTRVGAYQYADVATQLWVARCAGASISAATVRHLARPVAWWRLDVSAVRFRDTDVSGLLGRFIDNRPAVAAAAREAIRGAEPMRQMGMHCYKPLACEFRAYCQAAAGVPEFGKATSNDR